MSLEDYTNNLAKTFDRLLASETLKTRQGWFWSALGRSGYVGILDIEASLQAVKNLYKANLEAGYLDCVPAEWERDKSHKVIGLWLYGWVGVDYSGNKPLLCDLKPDNMNRRTARCYLSIGSSDYDWVMGEDCHTSLPMLIMAVYSYAKQDGLGFRLYENSIDRLAGLC